MEYNKMRENTKNYKMVEHDHETSLTYIRLLESYIIDHLEEDLPPIVCDCKTKTVELNVSNSNV